MDIKGKKTQAEVWTHSAKIECHDSLETGVRRLQQLLHCKGKGWPKLNVMCLTMINLATPWFEVTELPNFDIT